jgi:DNA-binding transcriptional ArsR family regulator
LGVALASELAQVFEVLASNTRLRLLHALVLLGDPCMSDLAEAVDMKPQAVSNQLRRLVDLGILTTRRHGTHIHYTIVDPCVLRLMHHGLCLNEEARAQVQVSAS